MWHRLAVRDLVVLLVSFVAGIVVAVLVVRPLAAPQIGFDTAASVLHFQRLVAGERLEAFVTTTPKPLLTLVDGVLHALGGWTAVAWGAMAMHGLAAGLVATLAGRLGGPVAAAWVAVALIGNGFLLVEASYAYAVPVAVALWSAAGLAVTETRPRWGLAGSALLLATLARFETLVIVAVSAVVLVAAAFVARSLRRRGDAVRALPRRAWLLVLLPLAALPIMLAHDWLLTGDPFFWSTVSERYTAQARQRTAIAGPAEVVLSIAGLVTAQGLVAILAVVGGLWLAWRRAWVGLVALAALGPAMAGFLVLLAARGTYVSGRYGAPIELAVLFAAGIGLAWLVGLTGLVGGRPAANARTGLTHPAGQLAAAGATAAVAAIALMPWGPFDAALTERIATERALQANAALALPAIAEALDRIPGSRDRPALSAGVTVPSGRRPVLLVPGLLRPRLAVDLDLPVDVVGGLTAAGLDPDAGLIGPGQVIIHDPRGGQAARAFRFLETTEPFTDRGLAFRPVFVDPARRIWVHAVTAAP